jgi:tellurite resistance protein
MSAIFDTGEAQEIARALAAVAAADGAIVAREESILDGFAMAHSVGAHAFLGKPLDAERLARAIQGDEKRREVLRLCVRMALADGEYAAAEAQAIERIADAFAVPRAELATLVAAART